MKIDFNYNDFIMLIPFLIILGTALIILVSTVFNGKNNLKKNFFSSFIITIIAITGMLISTFFVIWKGINISEVKYFLSNKFVFDEISFWLMSLSIISMIGIFVLFRENIFTKKDFFAEQIFLLLSSLLGMMVLISANDLILLFIGLELMLVPIYLLIPINKESIFSNEAAIKFFILSSLASVIYLLGLSLVFGTTGSTGILKLSEISPVLLEQDRMFLLGYLLILLSILFKVSAFPFWFWVPDTYQGASTPLTAMLASSVKVASFAAFYRILTCGYFEDHFFINVFSWIIVLTMFVGNVTAIMQNNFKRMLAYSSIAHSGYLLISLIIITKNEYLEIGVQALIYYLIFYCIVTIGIFAVVSLLEKKENSIILIEDFKNLHNQYPLLSFCIMILLFSLAGIPPTSGFFAKFSLFFSAIISGFSWIVFWAIINSVIAIYYYIRPILFIYMYSQKSFFFDGVNSSLYSTKFIIYLMSCVSIFLGLFLGFL